MRNKLFIVTMVLVSAIALSSCAARQANIEATWARIFQSTDVILTRDPQNSFYDITKGLEVHVVTTQPKEENSSLLYHLSDNSCFAAPTMQYVRAMGMSEMSPNSDYHLFVTINKADIVNQQTANVGISVRLKDSKGEDVFSQKDISATNTAGKHIDIRPAYSRKVGGYMFNRALDEAYTQALEQINWNRIASLLRTEQLPKDEPQKPVQGLGDTALEQTIIRWDVQSRPQGADISWRVVSKTPEVKSTNEKYLQTTPYEATKSLDIRGLTYQTAGDVRIILRCVKDGYLPQEKEYNVRMVLDQEEISAFFRLVKEE